SPSEPQTASQTTGRGRDVRARHNRPRCSPDHIPGEGTRSPITRTPPTPKRGGVLRTKPTESRPLIALFFRRGRGAGSIALARGGAGRSGRGRSRLGGLRLRRSFLRRPVRIVEEAEENQGHDGEAADDEIEPTVVLHELCSLQRSCGPRRRGNGRFRPRVAG